MLNTFAENKFQLLIGSSWEEWQVLQTFALGDTITRYTVKRMADDTEHILPIEKVYELYETIKLKLC